MDLKEKRLQKGYTQRVLSEKLQLSESSISLYENKKRLPSVRIAQLIAEILGFDWTEFYE